MATRLYPTAIVPPVSPAFGAGWENTVALRARLSLLVADYAGGSASFPPAAGTGVANDDVLHGALYLGPLAAQSIGGTLKGQNLGREANVNVTARAQALAKVVSADGTTVRGTLLEMDTAAPSSWFAVSTGTRTNRNVPRGGAQTLTAVQAFDGDWLVIEYGHRNHGTNTSVVAFRGCDTAGVTTDLPEDETSTGTDSGIYRNWFEFSQDIRLWRPRQQVLIHDVGVGAL